MRPGRYVLLPLVGILLVGAVMSDALRGRVEAAASNGADYAWGANGGRLPLTPELQDDGLRFDSDVAPADRAAVLRAIATARPAAQSLIHLVDGAVTVSVGAPGPGVAGLTSTGGDGRYHVTLDLGSVYRADGDRGVARVVLHELGHVVDFALVDDTLLRRLDAEIPPSYPCGAGGAVPVCSDARERFAETFAKWANGDLGVNVYEGYRIPPPASLEAWGEPLVALGG